MAIGGCGCAMAAGAGGATTQRSVSPTGSGGAPTAPDTHAHGGGAQASAGAAQLDAPLPTTRTTQSSGFVPGPGGSGPGLRDRAAAQSNLDNLIRLNKERFATEALAKAAGYVQNPKNPDHWHRHDLIRAGDSTDLANPATLMFRNGRLVAVMLAQSRANPVDFGAGAWHDHSGANEPSSHMHVFLDRPVETAYGTE